jgi:transposase
MQNSTQHYLIAIDIAKDSLQVQTCKEAFSLTNDKRGFARLLAHTRKHTEPLVVFEATGGYERPLFDYLHSHGLPCVIINPRRLRAFAKSEGMKAKTDPIDAAMILRFAQEKELRTSTAPSLQQRHLADLLERRAQLVGFIAREKNRMQKAQAPHPSVAASQRRVFGAMEKELERIAQAIRELVASHPDLQAPAKLIMSVKGVGEVTAWTILAYLREINQLSRNQLVALVGVAPFNEDSGTSSKRRYIQGGRAKIRRALYMAAHSAASCNPVITTYVHGLRSRGKPYKCAIVAAMRKLIIHIQSLLKKSQLSPC